MQAPRRLQLRRGNTAAVSTYLGAQGEVIVNTDTNTLYVHDGVTVGGHAITANVSGTTGNYSNSNVKTYLSNFDGNLIPSANVTYSLGSINNQWRDLFVSNNTIYIGGIPLGITDGNLTINGNIIPTKSYIDSSVADVTVDLTGYATESYVDSTISNISIPSEYGNANVTAYLTEPLTLGNLTVAGNVISRRLEETTTDGILTETNAIGSKLTLTDNSIAMEAYADPEGPNNIQYSRVTASTSGLALRHAVEVVGGETYGELSISSGLQFEFSDGVITSTFGVDPAGLVILSNGSYLEPQGSDLNVASQGVVRIKADDADTSTTKAWTFDKSGTLTTPLLLPVTFTAVLDSEHMVQSVELTDTPWEFVVEFQVNPDGNVQTMIGNNTPQVTNPGYVDGHEFEYTEADHGIPGYTFTLGLYDVLQAGPAGWTTNLAASEPPVYSSTVKSLGAIKLTADTNSWAFGTDGKLTVPGAIFRDGSLYMNSQGSTTTASVIALGNAGSVILRTSNQETNHDLTFDVDGNISFPGSLEFSDGSTYSNNTLTGAVDTDLVLAVKYRSRVSHQCYIGTADQFVADIEFNDDITVTGVGWTVEVDGITYTVTSIPEDTPANQFRLDVPGATFVSTETYTFINPNPVEKSWTINSQNGTLIASGGAILSNETAPFGEGEMYRDFSIELPTSDGLNEHRLLFQNTGKVTLPGELEISGQTYLNSGLIWTPGNGAVINYNSTDNFFVIAGNYNFSSVYWKFHDSGLTEIPADLQFPDDTTYAGDSITLPTTTNGSTNSFTWNFSDQVIGSETVTLNWNLLGVNGSEFFIGTGLASTTGYYKFDGIGQTLGFIPASGVEGGGRLTYGQSAKAGTGSVNDIEVTSSNGNVYIRANNNSWEFGNTGNLILPQTNMVSSPAPTSLPGIKFTDGTFQTTAYGNTQVGMYLASDTEKTFGGNVQIEGNLFVNGNVNYVSTNSYTVTDNIISIADGNPADTLDLGFTAHRTVGSTLQHTGLVRDSSAGNWKLFSNVTTQPGTQVDFTDAVYDDLVVGNITSPTITDLYANLGSVAGSLSTLTSNAAVQAGDIATIYANLGVVAGNLSTLTSNAAVQAGLIADLQANAAVQAGLIANAQGNYSNANVASYLPTYSGNIGGTLTTAAQTNITTVGTLGNLAVTGNVTATNFNGIHVGNASGTTASYTGNVTAGNVTASGNVTAAYIVTTGGYGNISQVDTITANTGVYSGNITASGIAGFYAPNRPGFRVTGPGGQIASVTQVTGASLVVDFNQGSYLNTTTGYFTAPVAGLYQVNLVVRTYTNTGVSAQAVVENNSTVIIMIEWAANTTMNHTGGSTVIKLAVGDTLRFRVLLGSISFDANDNWSVAYLG